MVFPGKSGSVLFIVFLSITVYISRIFRKSNRYRGCKAYLIDLFDVILALENTYVFLEKDVHVFPETRTCFFENMYVFYSNLYHNLYSTNYKPVTNYFKQMLYCIFLIRLLCRLLQWHNRVNYSSTCT